MMKSASSSLIVASWVVYSSSLAGVVHAFNVNKDATCPKFRNLSRTAVSAVPKNNDIHVLPAAAAFQSREAPRNSSVRSKTVLSAILRGRLLDAGGSSSNAPVDMGGILTNNNNKNRPPSQTPQTTVRERLLRMSNIASFLCVIDCTLLPIVTVIFPLIGIGAASSLNANFLHKLGHSAAIFFVLPIGGLAASMNFLSHGKKKIFAVAVLGLLLIYVANGHVGGPILSRLPRSLAYSLHCGTLLHRCSNIVGSTLLIGSNILSHQLMQGMCAYGSIMAANGARRSENNGGSILRDPTGFVGFCCAACFRVIGGATKQDDGEVFFMWK